MKGTILILVICMFTLSCRQRRHLTEQMPLRIKIKNHSNTVFMLPKGCENRCKKIFILK